MSVELDLSPFSIHNIRCVGVLSNKSINWLIKRKKKNVHNPKLSSFKEVLKERAFAINDAASSFIVLPVMKGEI